VVTSRSRPTSPSRAATPPTRARTRLQSSSAARTLQW
jgi:hypothetical protein